MLFPKFPQSIKPEELESSKMCSGSLARKRFLKPSQSGPRSDQMVLARMVWLLLSQTYHTARTCWNYRSEQTSTGNCSFLDDDNSLENGLHNPVKVLLFFFSRHSPVLHSKEGSRSAHIVGGREVNWTVITKTVELWEEVLSHSK
ncbi:hypothetical protein GCK32_008209 [Trichostrongylus colubriformis]|uniref:Uncharacterized protein n=1 Tax=Trichostrongylus colubriformis TaxID=6319 RepID=A0AAN8FJC6_TRICO